MQPADVFIPQYVQAWQGTLWLLMTLAMFLAWWAYFARRHSQEFSLAERILAAFIATVCQILATTFILGWIHQLRWWPLGILNAAFTLSLGVWTATARSGRPLHREVFLALGAAWQLLRSSTALWALAAIAVLSAGWLIYLGQLLPPFAWDAWSYHLPWAAFAHQEGHLGPFDQPTLWVNIFPKNTDILFLWWILGAGTERWANIAQAPFAFAAALSCYLLARRAGARRVDAVIAGLLIFSVPVVLHMMWVAMVDLAVMGTALVSLAFLSRRRLTPMTLVVAGCAAGFMVGTKGSSVWIFLWLLALLLYRLLPLGMDALRDRPGKRLKGFLMAVALFCGMTFAFGSYFYLRNWALYGNPTGDYEIKMGSIVLFEGERGIGEHFSRRHTGLRLHDALEDSEWMVLLDGLFDPQKEFYYANRIGGWGSPWTVLMVPAIPIALIYALLRRRWAVIAIIFACLLPYLLWPHNRTELRYHLQIFGAGPPAFALLLTLLQGTGYRRFLLTTAAACMLATSLVATAYREDLQPNAIDAARRKPYQLSNRYVYHYRFGDRSFRDALRSVQEPGSTLAFSFDEAPQRKLLAVWNTSYTNRAVHVPWEGNGDRWEAALRESGADAVYVEPSEALSWTSLHPGSFEPIYESESAGIYRLVQPDGAD